MKGLFDFSACRKPNAAPNDADEDKDTVDDARALELAAEKARRASRDASAEATRLSCRQLAFTQPTTFVNCKWMLRSITIDASNLVKLIGTEMFARLRHKG